MRYIYLILLLTACAQKTTEEAKWYKGNTHTHTVICGHADAHPDTVARWYLDRDYNFLILSEHNHFIDPDSVNLPADRRTDFILIPGEEVTDQAHIHTTAMNIHRLIPPLRPASVPDVLPHGFKNAKVYLMQMHTDSILGAHGIPILNHPNWQSGVPASDIMEVAGLEMIELYNGHPDVNNWGSDQHASMEQKWDSLLTAGRKMYGVSSDDAHFFHDWGIDVSNPGRGWVMVKSEKLTPDAITNAMAAGDFYSSNGVILATVERGIDSYDVAIDTAATMLSLESPYVVGYKGPAVEPGFLIEFIGDNGKILHSSKSLKASFPVPGDVSYVRAKVTYTRDRSTSSEQFFAWTQPVFLKK